MEKERIIQMLHSDGYLDAENYIRSLEAQVMSYFDELSFLRNFIRENCFDEELYRDRMRVLWTSLCLHRNYNVDTQAYNTTPRELWEVLQETGDGTSHWSNFNTFDNFMCAYLM